MGHGILRGVAVSCTLWLLACTDPALVGVADDVRNPLATAGAPVDPSETGGDDSSDDAGPAANCIEDGDCALGYSCEDGACVTESIGTACVVDGDCAAGLSCEHGDCIVETEDD